MSLFLLVDSSLANDWRLERDEGAVQVYSRAVEGSSIRAVRGVTWIDSSLIRIVNLLWDPTVRPTWDKYCGETYTLESRSAREKFVYVHTELPWPVRDRDMVNSVTWEQAPDTLVVTMRAVATKGFLPRKKDRVRVVQSWSTWTLTPLSGGGVAVEFSAHIDPAGPLPSWLINTLSVESPYDILKRLRGPLANHQIQRDLIGVITEIHGNG
ncbi:START domain-containing protein [Zhongshania arctica]|uniref:START domain-containing protein n=1 Tax=Zhongshania arctica TaxID=3238302 RepID=A0ABV3TVC4_9GAMM